MQKVSRKIQIDDWRLRPPRTEIAFPATIRAPVGPVPAIVRNVSAWGLMAECEAMLPIGCRIQLDCGPFGQVWAQVRWALGGRAGFALADAPADPEGSPEVPARPGYAGESGRR